MKWRLITAYTGDEAWTSSEHPTQESAISQRETLLRRQRYDDLNEAAGGKRKVKKVIKWTAIVYDHS